MDLPTTPRRRIGRRRRATALVLVAALALLTVGCYKDLRPPTVTIATDDTGRAAIASDNTIELRLLSRPEAEFVPYDVNTGDLRLAADKGMWGGHPSSVVSEADATDLNDDGVKDLVAHFNVMSAPKLVSPTSTTETTVNACLYGIVTRNRGSEPRGSFDSCTSVRIPPLAGLVDNNPVVRLASSSVSQSVDEGETATFTLTRTGDIGQQGATYYVWSSAGTAESGVHFDEDPDQYGTVTFTSGASTADFDVVTLDDGVDDGDHTLVIELRAPGFQTSRMASPSVATLTILDVPVTEAPSARWQEAPVTGPTGRHEMASAYDTVRNETVIFGGGSTGETWVWDGDEWTQRAIGAGPPGRNHATMAYHPGTQRVVLFGGADALGSFGDTWVWNGTTWTETTDGSAPAPDADAAMAYDVGTGTLVLLTDAGTYTGTGGAWTAHAGAEPSSSRSGAVLAQDADSQLVLFGGFHLGGSPLSDTWIWNGAWTQLTGLSDAPSARGQAVMAYDATEQRTVLFGGTSDPNGGDTPLGDTWIWDGSAWAEASTTASPDARERSTMAEEPGGDLVLFGGADFDATTTFGDTWLVGTSRP